MRTYLALLTASLFALAAQPAHGQRIAVGARGGLNLANADADGAIFSGSVGRTTGFHAGIVGNVEISRFFAVQTQFLISQKGFDEGDGDVSVDVTYLEIPVLAMIQIPGRISPHVYFGPVLALESGCTATTASAGEEQCADAVTAPRTKGADSGIMLGGGIKYDAGPGYLLADLLYAYGLTDVAEISDTVDSIKLRTFYFSLGYLFRVGSEYP